MTWIDIQNHDVLVEFVVSRIERMVGTPKLLTIADNELSDPRTGVLVFDGDGDAFAPNIVVTMRSTPEFELSEVDFAPRVTVLHRSISMGASHTGEWSLSLYPSFPSWVVSERLSVEGIDEGRAIEFSSGLGARSWMRRVVDNFAFELFSNMPSIEGAKVD